MFCVAKASCETDILLHYHSFGIFRLTSPDGLREITNCRNQDSFHPHSEQSVLYEVNLTTCHTFKNSHTFVFSHRIAPGMLY